MATQSVLLKAPMSANTGYGNDGFALARAFDQAGLDIRLLPVSVVPPIPMGVAQLMVKPVDLDFDYLVHHVAPDSIGLTDAEKRMTDTKKVAWTMWEFTGLTEALKETFAAQLEGYDLLLAYDEVSAAAFAEHAEKAGVEMRILQGGYWSEDWDYDTRQRDWTGPFRFCMVGQLHARKNPFAAIHAFNEVRKNFEDVELHLKTNVRSLHPAMEQTYPGLKIHYDVWPHSRLKNFYAECHTYVASSWGEGKNLPALEAQTMGIPVIYSDFGGHRQWGASDMGWPVAGTIEEHEPGMGSYRIDHDGLVAAMTDAVTNRFKTRNKGELAARVIPTQCEWSKVVQRFLDTT